MRRREFVMLVGTAVVWPLVARAEQRSSLPASVTSALQGPPPTRASRANSWRGFAISATLTANRSRSSFNSRAGDPERLAEAAANFVQRERRHHRDVRVGHHCRAARDVDDSDRDGDGFRRRRDGPRREPRSSRRQRHRVELLPPRADGEAAATAQGGLAVDVEGGGALPPGRRGDANILEVMGAAAKALSLDLSPIEVSGPEEFESAFSSWAEQKVSAVVVLDIFTTLSPAIAALAAKHRFASIGRLELATAGSLIGYGVDFPPMYRRAAVFVDKSSKAPRPARFRSNSQLSFRPSSISGPPRRSDSKSRRPCSPARRR